MVADRADSLPTSLNGCRIASVRNRNQRCKSGFRRRYVQKSRNLLRSQAAVFVARILCEFPVQNTPQHWAGSDAVILWATARHVAFSVGESAAGRKPAAEQRYRAPSCRYVGVIVRSDRRRLLLGSSNRRRLPAPAKPNISRIFSSLLNDVIE
jgi:hypothetical protein